MRWPGKNWYCLYFHFKTSPEYPCMCRARVCLSWEAAAWSLWISYPVFNLSLCVLHCFTASEPPYTGFKLPNLLQGNWNAWKMVGYKENMDYILIKRACWVKGWCTSCGDVHLYFPCELSFFFSESSLNWQLKECKNKCPISCCSYKIFHYFRNIMYQS